MPYIDTLRGKEVVISGNFRDFGVTKAEMRRLAKRAGARHAGEDPRTSTEVFVRGESPLYKYGSYGDKEAELAWKAPTAVVIDGRRFFDLLDGKRVRAWAPNEAPAEEASIGVPFQPLPVDVATAEAEPFTRDPELVDRGLQGHRLTLNALAAVVAAAGCAPLQADDPECMFDLAWETARGIWVAEVKSLTHGNERLQLRLGLGQVLDYAHGMGAAGHKLAGKALAVERPPSDQRWTEICGGCDVHLVWPGTLESLFD